MLKLCYKLDHNAGTMLDTGTMPSCPKLCRHNVSNPSECAKSPKGGVLEINLYTLFIYLYTLFIQKFQFSIAGLNGDLYLPSQP